MSTFTLTEDQQNALERFTQFLTDPTETVFVLSGYSGTGKTTLIKYLLDLLPKFMKTARLINPRMPEYEVSLTATTNKAAENFAYITGMEVKTIHSFLGLRVQTDYTTRETTLVPHTKEKKEERLLFIDEASKIDSLLLQWIFKLTNRCKIIFMGDPAQLTQVKSLLTPVFHSHFNEARLEKVVRQAEGNPIVELSTKFRETVNTGKFFSFVPDGHHIQHMDRDSFNDEALKEFTRPDWKHRDSKILAWTNQRVVDYNHWLNEQVKGDCYLQKGDYAICNSYIQGKKGSIKTDQLVCITDVNDSHDLGITGQKVRIDYLHEFFLPHSLTEKNAVIKHYQKEEKYSVLDYIARNWIDLRAAFACTVDKSQGSTYDRVFIDLDDISRCNSGNQIARMLYVAVSRAREQVFLTGDIC